MVLNLENAVLFNLYKTDKKQRKIEEKRSRVM